MRCLLEFAVCNRVLGLASLAAFLGCSTPGLAMPIEGRLAPAAPAAIRVLNEQPLIDMVVGAGIYCTRGVNTASQIQRVVDAYRAGQVFRLLALVPWNGDF